MQENQRFDEASLQALQFTEYMVNSLAESAKQCWRWWGQLGEPMIQATDEWAETQRRHFESLRENQRAEGGSEPRLAPRTPTQRTPFLDLYYNPWPGPGDSEGGGWG
jgi:hypothetical protein